MSDRQIKYCTADDGTRIAYCVEGTEGTTIIAAPVMTESFALDHLMPVYREFYRELGAGRRIVRFDYRNTGLSGRVPLPEVMAQSDYLLDIEAVARAAGGDRFVLWAPTVSGPRAILFAVKNPDRVSHLILYGTFAVYSDAMSDEFLNGLRDLAKANWEVATQTIADMNGRREFPNEAAELGEWYRLSQTAEEYLESSRRLPQENGPVLSALQVPTLVLHRILDKAIPFSAGQKLAAEIPGARFVALQEKGHLFCLGDYSEILSAVDSFLGDRKDDGINSSAARRPSTFKTILFTDLAGHTEMMRRLGDLRGREVLREHERITRRELKAHGGTEVKTMGDGFLASFPSASGALECAVAIQKAVSSHNARATEPIQLRIGLNAGEPLEEDGDLFGATVIIAARIAAKAEPGEILVSDVVHGLCAGKGFRFTDRGAFEAKGLSDPVQVYSVSWKEGA